MFGRKKANAEARSFVKIAVSTGERDAFTTDGEDEDDMLSAGIAAAHAEGITDPDLASDFALWYADGYKSKLEVMDFLDGLRDPEPKPKS